MPDHLGTKINQDRWIVTGPSRSGTTLVASLLSRLGINFGLEDRSWDINSGYYEHPEILKAYSNTRKSKKLAPLSDNLSSLFRKKSINHVRRALREVKAIKYPPLSSELPDLVKQAGYTPRITISLRRFDTYALSRIRKEGVDWSICRNDYISIYNTALFNLRLYGGAVLAYEELTGGEHSYSLTALMQITGSNEMNIAAALEQCVREGRSKTRTELHDSDCNKLYELLLSCR